MKVYIFKRKGGFHKSEYCIKCTKSLKESFHLVKLDTFLIKKYKSYVYMSGPVLSTGDIVENKTKKVPLSGNLHSHGKCVSRKRAKNRKTKKYT